MRFPGLLPCPECEVQTNQFSNGLCSACWQAKTPDQQAAIIKRQSSPIDWKALRRIQFKRPDEQP